MRIASLLLLAGLGASALAGTATASDTFPGRNGRVAVIVTERDDPARPTSVMTMSPDGSHRKMVTRARAGRDAGPTSLAFSPDGRWMVFDRRACAETCRHNVGVMRSDGSGKRLLTHRRHRADTNFGFSPDGSLIGFTRDARSIFVADAHGGRPERLVRYGVGVAATGAAFSPDGKSVLFDKFEAHYRDGVGTSTEHVCVIAIASREESCLAEGSSPRWAPDGQSIVFTDPDGTGISTMRPDGSGQAPLIPGPSRMRPLAFSPDGEHLAFLREAGAGRTLFIARSDGTQPRRITHDRHDFEADLDMAFSPDGRKVTYRRSGRKRFHVSRIDGSHEKPLAVTPKRIEGAAGSLAWAPRRGQ